MDFVSKPGEKNVKKRGVEVSYKPTPLPTVKKLTPFISIVLNGKISNDLHDNSP